MRKNFAVRSIRRYAGILVAAALLAGSAFAAWAEEAESETEMPEEALVLGTQSEEEGVRSFTIRNETGLDILYLSVKDASMVAFEENYLAQDTVLEDGKEGILYYDARQKEEPYLIAILFDGDVHTQAVMHAFPWEAGEGDLVLSESKDIFGSDKVAYIKAEAEDGSEILTEEEELEAYKNGGSMFLLPDPTNAADGEKDANEGCVGDDALFN